MPTQNVWWPIVVKSSQADVLIVDENQKLADLYAGWLADTYSVRVAYNESQAVQCFDESVKVVLLEHCPPASASDELIKKVNDSEHNCQVVLLTEVDPDDEAIGTTFDNYLPKPINYVDLKQTVDQLLDRVDYNKQIGKYARLTTRKATLKAEKSPPRLRDDVRFQQLESRIERLESTVDDLVRNFDRDDVAAVLRDLPPEQGV